jgi:putative FmdB family regulatory protein
MPVYEYQCSDCGQSFEIKQSFKDNPLTVCPNCAGKIHRVPQAAGVVFKGSGWYITDSKGKQNLATPAEKKANGEGGQAAAEKAESSASGSDNGNSAAKPAAAATPAPAAQGAGSTAPTSA